MGEKKKFKMPHALVIMITIIFIATALTWIIPAGQYARVTNAMGVKVVDPASFKFVSSAPVNPLRIPLMIVQSLISKISLMYTVIFAGAAFHMIAKSGALQVAVGRVSQKFQNKGYLFVPVMTTIFALICTTQAVNHFIAFAPIMTVIALGMGMDSIVGVSLILLGGAIGFSTAGLNINTAVLAQKLAEVPIYTGLEYRAFCFVVFLIVTNVYLVMYAKKVYKNPELSPVYDLDQKREERNVDLNSFGTMDWRKTCVLLVLVLALVVMIYGNSRLKWDLKEDAALFIVMAVIEGALLGMGPSQIATEFVNGSKTMLGAAFLLGLAGTIGSVLKAGKIIDTVIFGAATVLNQMPEFLLGPAMFIANVLINFVIVSGSGQAAAVMPIMSPLADIIGITRQTAILAFTFGDGFCNYILPHSSALMGILGAAQIPYDRWMKFMGKLFLIWLLTGCILCSIAQMIHYGPI